jgi:hypothetical protein
MVQPSARIYTANQIGAQLRQKSEWYQTALEAAIRRPTLIMPAGRNGVQQVSFWAQSNLLARRR